MIGDKNSKKTGYKLPPKNSQWRKGQSGNPKGRPKGAKNKRYRQIGTTSAENRDVLLAQMEKVIDVQLDGKSVKMSKIDVVMERVLSNAMVGDFKSAHFVLTMRDALIREGQEDFNLIYQDSIREIERYFTGIYTRLGVSKRQAEGLESYALYKKLLKSMALRKIYGEEIVPFDVDEAEEGTHCNTLRENFIDELKEL